MSDREIKIKIKSTADMSGVKSAKESIDDLIVRRRSLESLQSQFMTAQQAEVAAVNSIIKAKNRERDARKKANDQIEPAIPTLNQLDTGQKAVTKSSRNMGMAVLEGSRAFEDMQYGIRGALNNIPGLVMMLGGTAGIAGAASAAAVTLSILGPKIAEMLGSADDTKGLEDFNELLNETAKRMQEIVSKRAAAAQQDWLDTIDDEEEGITRQNAALAANIKLLEARRLAKLSREDAEREKRKAEIDANPGMSESEKIQAKAGIDEAGERAKAKEKLDSLQQEVIGGYDGADQADALAKRKAEDLLAVQASKAELEAQKKKLEQEKRSEENLIKATPKLKERKKEFESDKFWQRAFDSSADTSGLDSKIEELEKRIADAESAPSRKDRIETKLSAIDEPLKQTQSRETELKQDAEQSKRDAERARADAESREAIAREQAGAIRDTYQTDRETRGIRTNQRASDAEARTKKEAADEAKREADKKKSEAEKLEREKNRIRDAERDLEIDITGIGRDAADATRGIGARGVNPEGFNALAGKIAKKGDPQGDKIDLAAFLEKVSMLVDAIPDSSSSSKDAEKLRQVERKLEKKIADLSSRLTRNSNKK